MRVSIKAEKFRLYLILPTNLLLNPCTLKFVVYIIKKKFPEYQIEPSDMLRLFKEIKACKRKYKKIELVNIVTSDGDKIYVRI